MIRPIRGIRNTARETAIPPASVLFHCLIAKKAFTRAKKTKGEVSADDEVPSSSPPDFQWRRFAKQVALVSLVCAVGRVLIAEILPSAAGRKR